jgi:hypothetical protein
MGHTAVDLEGNQFTATSDGKKVIQAADDRVPDPGKVGVYTQSLSITLFDVSPTVPSNQRFARPAQTASG